MKRPALVLALALSSAPAFAQQEPLDPLDHMVELGVFGGAFMASRFHSYVEEGVAAQRPLRPVIGNVGLRLAYFPLSFFGVEAEGSYLPGAGIAEGDDVTMFGGRGHLMLQIPWRMSFFLLAGGGVRGVSSDPAQLGSVMVPEGYWGSGVKFFFHRYFALRFEGRHVLTSGLASNDNEITSHGEVMLGLTMTFNRIDEDGDEDGVPDWRDRCKETWGDDKYGCPLPDADHDGVPDESDKCPRGYGVPERDGCAEPSPPPVDRDGDGVEDRRDRCPDEKGLVKDGCPDPDPDKDGVLRDRDQCPNEPGLQGDGCPLHDMDGDLIEDAIDQCKEQAEIFNGYQDRDGCPDEVPAAVKKFAGRLEGIRFGTGNAKILPASYKVLDEVVKVMKEFKDFRVEISGHTDNVGGEAKNQKLSMERASAVRDYLVAKGVETVRVVATGYGPTRPAADNKTAAGREKNRRIEFMIIQ